MSFLPVITACVIAFFLGSIPTGLLLTKWFTDVDLRAIGSGNIGATNVLRTGKKGLALGTLVGDAAKGIIAIMIARYGLGLSIETGLTFVALFAVLGHCFTPWLKFRGGKGVATALGVAFGLNFLFGLSLCAVWLVTAIVTRISSASALAALVAAPFIGNWLLGSASLNGLILLSALVLFQHRANIRRLIAGEEPTIALGNDKRPKP